MPIIDSICFSITKGDSDITCVSLFVDSIIINFGKFSYALKSVEASISSSWPVVVVCVPLNPFF